MDETDITIEDFYRQRKMFDLPSPLQEVDMDNHYSHVSVARLLMQEAMIYCRENFGDGWLWSSPVHTETSKIWFLQSEDVLLFKLRFNTV